MPTVFFCILWFAFCIPIFWYFIILRKFKCPPLLKQDDVIKNGDFTYTFDDADKLIIKYTKDQKLIKKTNRYKLYYSDWNWHCRKVMELPKSTSILFTLFSLLIILGTAFEFCAMTPQLYDHSLGLMMWVFPLSLFVYYEVLIFLFGAYRGQTYSEGFLHWKVFKKFIKSSNVKT